LLYRRWLNKQNRGIHSTLTHVGVARLELQLNNRHSQFTAMPCQKLKNLKQSDSTRLEIVTADSWYEMWQGESAKYYRQAGVNIGML
jgi:hypothetical protein